MNPRPWNPRIELDGALRRGNLRHAKTLAEELRIEGKAIPLELAWRFLPLIAEKAPAEYDAWAIRWLRRWLDETGTGTIEQAADVAGILANLPVDPHAGEAIQAML